MLDDECEEEVVYLEHGCDYDSNEDIPFKKTTLHSNISVTENDYLLAERRAAHQEAPKFRRSENNGQGSLRNKNKLSAATEKIRKNFSYGDGDGDGDGDGGDDGDIGVHEFSNNYPSSTSGFDFTNYKSKRHLSPSTSTHSNRPRHADGHSTRITSSVSSRVKQSVAALDYEEELDRPTHWGKRSHNHHRTSQNGAVRVSVPGSKQQQSRRQSHPSTIVTVSKPFAHSVAEKLTQQKRNGRNTDKHNGSLSVLQLSFQPSWLPVASTRSQKSGRDSTSRKQNHSTAEVEPIASQDDYDGGDNHTIVSQNAFDSPPSGLNHGSSVEYENSSVSYDPTFRPPVTSALSGSSSPNKIVTIPKFPTSTSSSPYASDQDNQQSTHQQSTKRARRTGSKQTHERDLLPKFLRMKRLQAELELRFQSSLRTRDASVKGRNECKQHFRNGDLQDPRSRTKSHIDVTIVMHSEVVAGKEMIVWEQPPFVVLALKVDDISDNQSEGQLHLDHRAKRMPSGIVLGFFKPETFMKMGVSVAVGQRLRIYDFVVVPGAQQTSPALLLCTTLCETL